MKDVNERIKTNNAATAGKKRRKKKKKKKAFGKQTGVPVQEDLVWDDAKKDTNNCPGCKHWYVMCVDDNSDVNRTNRQVAEEHNAAVAEWGRKPACTRGAKPKMKTGTTTAAKLACMCSKMHCRNRSDGRGCETCTDFAKNGQRPAFLDKNCSCSICQLSPCMTGM